MSTSILLGHSEPTQASQNILSGLANESKVLAMRSSAEARAIVLFEIAEKLEILPLEINRGKGISSLVIATSRVLGLEQLQILKFYCDHRIDFVFAELEVINTARFCAYFGDDATLLTRARMLEDGEPAAQAMEEFSDKSELSEIGQFVWALIRFALARGASDIHLTPLANGLALRVRIDGQLLDNDQLPIGVGSYQKIARYILIHSRLDPNEMMSQDGLLVCGSDSRLPKIRVNAIRSLHGLAIALRLPLQTAKLDVFTIEIPDATRAVITSFVACRRGLCLVAGPTGSGKTTLLYSIANTFIANGARLVTVEDPVECHLDAALQIEISDSLSQPSALKACLRQDPDVFMVGEIRTNDAATTVVNAAYSGHGVFASIHAGGIVEALLRFRSLGVESTACCSVIHSIHALRLAPTLCDHCKTIHLSASQASGISVFQRVGCSICNYTGYLGRVCLSESIVFDCETRSELEVISWSRASLRSTLCDSFIKISSQAIELLRGGKIDAETYWLFEKS
jgi:type IV pilus assembly protein PilB